MKPRMSEEAISDAAEAIGCDIAAIKAVIDVESRGGFLDDGRPKILFERHYFCKLTNGKYNAAAPDISSSKTGGYFGGVREWQRFERACSMDRDAALRSTSWGAFQIMGSNYKTAGFSGVEEFRAAMCESEDRQLDAFVKFVKSNGLDDELRQRDWPGFARGYNGPNYKKNNYDEKLRAAYLLHSRGAPRAEAVSILRMGSQGDDVEEVQEKLGITADGDFGPTTRSALIDFQRKNGLKPDGIVGAKTREKLFEVQPSSGGTSRGASDEGAPDTAPADGSTPEAVLADESNVVSAKLVDLLGSRIVREGARGSDVKAVQNALRAAGHTLVADGEYGRMTSMAVRAFQATYNLNADGEVGPATARALDAALAQRIAPLPEPVPSVVNIAPWLSRMRAISGTREIPGARSNPLILSWKEEVIKLYPNCKPHLNWYENDDTPWCGLAVAYVIAASDLRPPDAPLRALNWHEVWQSQGGKELDAPSRGAILVFKRPGGGHVGLYEGEDATTYFVRGESK